jgi:hypothetical protein
MIVLTQKYAARPGATSGDYIRILSLMGWAYDETAKE